MSDFRTEGQRQMFVRHLKDTGVITMDEYLLLVSLARGTRPAVTVQFKAFVERMCAERPEIAIAVRAKRRVLGL